MEDSQNADSTDVFTVMDVSDPIRDCTTIIGGLSGKGASNLFLLKGKKRRTGEGHLVALTPNLDFSVPL